MRSIREYAVKEWLTFKPLVEFGKQCRNDAVQQSFLKKRPASLDAFLQKTSALKNQNALCLVAFEEPEVLGFTLKMVDRHVADATPLVFDNSNNAGARQKIERVCQDQNVAYLALPGNPARHPNRSHGMAMTWIWHNVVRTLHPRNFGFIDHDLVPLEKIELSALIGDQAFYGVPNVGKWAWSLWAGFCLYAFAEVASLPLNFLNDFSRGVDTGGRNWGCLYSKRDHRKLNFADWRLFSVGSEAGQSRQIEIINRSWIHLAGVSYRDDYRKNLDFYAPLLQQIENGANWSQLQASVGKEKFRPAGEATLARNKRPRWRKSTFTT